MKSHRINFYEPKPAGIRCISYDDSTNRIAVSRADYSIEIWNVKEIPCQEIIIPGDPNLSVEAVSLCEGRLFTSGLHGYVLEYDLQTLLPMSQLLIMSGCPVWCMSVNYKKTQLAVGNEDGYVSLIDVIPSGLDFNKRLNKQEGSILCLDWHKNGNLIVTGSVDVIRTWDVQTGQVINRIMLSRESKNTPTVVWCIAILSDMTIVSGDSSGKTSFWDGNKGTLTSHSKSKKGDILSLTVSSKEDIIYSSGVDPTIVSYMQSHSNGMWMKSVQRVVHTHDIRALQLVGDLLISGGDDCNLVCTKYPPKIVITFYPFCQKSYVTVATEASCILLQYPNCVELWTIGKKNPVHLLRIKPKSDEKIISSSIASNGRWIAYSTRNKIRLFSIILNADMENSVPMSKVELPADTPPSPILLFSNDSSKLITLNKNKIVIFKCDSILSDIEAIIEDSESSDHIKLMTLSENDSYLACATYHGNVIIYCLKSLKVLCKLPKYKCVPTAMTFSPLSENLVIAYNDRKIVEYSIQKQAYTRWSKQKLLQELQDSSLYPIISMCFCNERLYLLEENAIYAIDRLEQSSANKRLKQSEKTETLLNESNFKTLQNFEHLSSIHPFNEEIILVQIPSSCILKSLPPPIWKKVYGT